MTELRFTDTNSADDSTGRAFGLEGNLYLPLVLSAVGAIGAFALLTFALHAGFLVGCGAAALPLLTIAAWTMFLKRGKPAGYDRDRIEEFVFGGSFSPAARDQEDVA